jgi:hypothetical protein
MLNALDLDTVYITFRYADAFLQGAPSTQETAREATTMESSARQILLYCQGRLS